MTFYRWLTKQKNRNDSVGDFARDVAADKPLYRRHKMPSGNFKTPRPWTRYLMANGASSGAFIALDSAWKEYREESL